MLSKIKELADNSKTIKLGRENVEDISLAKELALFILLYLVLFIFQVLSQTAVFILLPDTDSPLSVLSILFTFPIIIILVYIYLTKIEHRDFRSIGLWKDNCISSTLKGFLIGLVIFTLIVVIGVILGQYRFDGFDLSSAVYIIPFLIGLTIQSFSEEIYSRGWAMTYFTRRHSIYVALIVNCLIFALPHMTNNGVDVLSIVNVALSGFMLAVMFLRFDNLWICGGLHTAWNFSQGVLYGFKVSGAQVPSILNFSQVGYNIINGGAFGPESGLISTFVVVVVIIIAVYYKNS